MKPKQTILALAEIYGIKMTELRLNGYMTVLKDLTADELKTAFNRILEDENRERFPLPAQIKAMARPTIDPRDAAIESLDRLRQAVVKHGWPKPEEARKFLTSQEWAFVERRGGWAHFCGSEENNFNEPVIYAQMRDALQAENRTKVKGLTYMALSEAQSQQNAYQKQIADKSVMEVIEEIESKIPDQPN